MLSGWQNPHIMVSTFAGDIYIFFKISLGGLLYGIFPFSSNAVFRLCASPHSLAFQWAKSYRVLTKTKKEDERVSVSSVAFCSLSLSAFLLKVLLISVDVKAHALVRVWNALLLCKCSIISVVSARRWGCVSWWLCLLRSGNSELYGW